MSSLSTTTQVKSSIILDTTIDWDEWYFIVKKRAQASQVWEIIDSTSTTPSVALIRPLHPSPASVRPSAISYAELTPQECEILKFHLSEYRDVLARYERQTTALSDITNFILTSISRNCLMYIIDCKEAKEMIDTLKKRFAPTDRARELDLSRQYQQLKRPPRLQNIDKWLQQWEYTYKQSVRIELPDIQKNRALFDFLNAIKSIDTTFAGTQEVFIIQVIKENQIVPDLYELIEDFRNYLRITRSYTGKSHSAFPTLHGHEPNESQDKPSNSCVCGEYHFFRMCPYLVEHLCTPTWMPDPDIQKKIDYKLKKSPKLQAAIQRACKQTDKGRKPIEEKSKVDKPSDLGSFVCYSTFAMSNSTTYKLEKSWILDSGSDVHVCNDKARFVQMRQAKEDEIVYAGTTSYHIEAFGTCRINVETPNGKATMTLIEVAYIPGFLTNLVSLSRLMVKDVYWNTAENALRHAGKVLCNVQKVDLHWVLEYNPTSMSYSVFGSKKSEQPLNNIKKSGEHWHKVMGHASPEVISHLPTSTEGIELDNNTSPSTIECEPCSLAKAHQIISRRTEKEVIQKAPFERVAYDMIQMTTAYNNDKWISHFYCYYSHMNFVYTHAKKSQAVSIITEFLNFIKTQFSKQIRFFRTDGETSLGQTFDTLVNSLGIIIERSAPYTPAQNGAAERSGGVLVTKARAMRIQACLPTNMWPEIVMATGYIMNRTPIKGLDWKTPFEMIMDKKPSLKHMHVYGCRAYPLNKKIPRSEKLNARAHIGYLVGYNSTNIFRIWIPSIQRVIMTRDVTFNESIFYDPSDVDLGNFFKKNLETLIDILPDSPASHEQDLLDSTIEFIEEPVSSVQNQDAHPKQTSYLPSPTLTASTQPIVYVPPLIDRSLYYPESNFSQDISLDSIAPRSTEISSDIAVEHILPEGSHRTRRSAYSTALSNIEHFSGYYQAFSAGLEHNFKSSSKEFHRDLLPNEPKNWKQMLKHKFTNEFRRAAQQEISTLQSRNTFKYMNKKDINIPTYERILPLIWVFKYKFDTKGFLSKFKARLCVRGDLQVTQQDFYTATLAIRTFRALMAITAAFDLECLHYDAINAFVNSKIDSTIFCECPEGFERPGQCIQLLRALYGLRQSPLLWYRDFTQALEELGLQPIQGVNCLFTNTWLIIFFYVDDIVSIYHPRHTKQYIEFETMLLKRYEMRILGDLKFFLGIQVKRDRENQTLQLSQSSYIDKIVTKFNLETKKPTFVPLSNIELKPYDGKATTQEIFMYQQRIGSINFVAVTTRPDVSFATSRLSEFLTNPSPQHINYADRLICYLHGTRDYVIEYSREVDKTQQIFLCTSDAAFADDTVTRRSSEGYLFKLFNGPVDWRSAKQRTVTTSSTEAELLSLSLAAKEMMWWKRFFIAINFDSKQPYTIYCDNLQTLRILTKESPKLDTKLRHIDVHQLWLRQEVQSKNILVSWLSTQDMPADGLTKVLPCQKHIQFIKQLNLVNTASTDSKISIIKSESEEVCQAKSKNQELDLNSNINQSKNDTDVLSTV